MRRIIFAILLVASGCITSGARRVRELDNQLKPQVQQASAEDIARRWGPPAAQETIGSTTFWTYYWSNGSKTLSAPVGSTVVTKSHERYDKVVLQFRDGRLADYSIDVVR